MVPRRRLSPFLWFWGEGQVAPREHPYPMPQVLHPGNLMSVSAGSGEPAGGGGGVSGERLQGSGQNEGEAAPDGAELGGLQEPPVVPLRRPGAVTVPRILSSA